MNKRLEKLRDHLSELFANARNGKYAPINSNEWLRSEDGYRAGFDAAVSELMRVVEIQQKGLVDIMDVDDRNESVTWDIADRALAEADAILNGEKDV